MNTLLGSQPRAQFQTTPTIDPTQQGSIPGFINLLNTVFGETAPGATAAAQQAQAALPGQLAYAAPQAPMVDPGPAFQTGVVDPVTQDFLQRTLPATAGQFGASAGGAFGSGSAEARGQASLDTSRALSQAGSQFKLATDTANQQAAIQNVLAANQAAQIRNTALAAAPGTAGVIPSALGPILQNLIATYFSPTQQTQGVSIGGSTGLLQTLLGAGAGGAGFGIGQAIGRGLPVPGG